MHLAKKWQQVVLAQAVKSNPFDQHHIPIVRFKNGIIDQDLQFHLVAFQQPLVHACHPFGSSLQTFAFRIFTQVG